jgi:N-acetylglucosamine kinase-like BadF-type ATPase
MPSKLSSCVVGIDVGGTNTDAVILQNEEVLAWHKTPTTIDIQSGVERAIEEVVKKADIRSSRVDSVKIGTTVSSFCPYEAVPNPLRRSVSPLQEFHFSPPQSYNTLEEFTLLIRHSNSSMQS